ncbi:Fe3+-hydroxamate ABC transporter substrate-binding protein [Paenibacillus elgii]|uniref:Fe3+-hydroxamate ABC transporter substrate-binding protein n=1 Tax=Paenibacillus elgii TaxID=189691 RepID=A0A163W345_9BACL|nr:ABC transporter substrate-binding protein [Paenibacillus elgii]KZE75783.1 Fe3+-hydroxamate ABC transporter substrate-binding protein [Paenibacillus elgii]
MKRILAAALSLLFVCSLLLLAACGQSTSKSPAASGDTPQNGAPKPAAYSPVTIENMGRTLTFKEAPKRAVSLNQHTTEIMLSLGLEKSMVGTAYMDDEILPALKEKYAAIPVLADKYPSLEVLLGAEPDFVYGRKSAFAEKGVGTVEALKEKGIEAYVAKGTYVPFGTLEDVYEDISNIGRIFNVQAKADALVESMKAKVKEIQAKVGKHEKPLRVFAFDSGQDTAYTAGKSLSTQLIELAGGKNIFDDVEKGWAKVSWEEVVKRDPEVILIFDYDKPSAAEKIKFLQSLPPLANVTAIKNNKFVIMPLSDVFEGVRNMTALEKMAKGFYPEKFN